MSNDLVNQPLSPEELFRNWIDWEMLSEQKEQLFGMLQANEQSCDKFLRRGGVEAINGILNLLDALQDCAVDYLGIPKNIVFPTIKKEE